MRILIVLVTAWVTQGAMAGAEELGTYYVSANTLNVRLSPSPSGKITNRLDRGSIVTVLELRSGWARISKYYDGYAEGVSGEVARWVSAAHLEAEKPQSGSNIDTASGLLVRALSSSDDYGKYRSQFVSSAKELIEKKTCSIDDFNESGGWTRSTTQGKAVYFVYCGGFTIQNRVYLNAATGKIYR